MGHLTCMVHIHCYAYGCTLQQMVVSLHNEEVSGVMPMPDFHPVARSAAPIRQVHVILG